MISTLFEQIFIPYLDFERIWLHLANYKFGADEECAALYRTKDSPPLSETLLAGLPKGTTSRDPYRAKTKQD